MKGYLKLIVMKELATRPLSGYSLMKVIKEHSGQWKPSAGSIYPLLRQLLKDKLLGFKQDKKKKIYYLTAKGKSHFETMDRNKEEMVNNLMAKISACESMTSDEAEAVIVEFHKRSHKTHLAKKLGGDFHSPLMQIQANLIRLFVEGKAKTSKAKIDAILKDTNKRLGLI
jgi:DNA-binding PadR family transcriptional regulator